MIVVQAMALKWYRAAGDALPVGLRSFTVEGNGCHRILGRLFYDVAT